MARATKAPLPAIAAAISEELRALGKPERAASAAPYFGLRPGQYGEGDRLLGVPVPQTRAVVRRHRGAAVVDALALLGSAWHEERLAALLLLLDAHGRSKDDGERRAIHEAYLAHTSQVNNWDLVDVSAAALVGPHVAPDDLALLDRLAASPSLWERRIAIIATHHHIRAGELRPVFHVAERLLGDAHDLIQKAVGWMLREAAKRDQPATEAFLRRHLDRLPRTTLRYAIERFSEPLRRDYLAGTVS